MRVLLHGIGLKRYPQRRARREIGAGWLLLLVTLLALAVRLPYWRTIPAAGDEVGQAVYAMRIVHGHGFPLVGNDAYAGPFFFYLLALLIRLGVADPLVGRTVVLVAGTLTATVTYAWVRQLGGNRVAGLVAALLVAANPHMILLNSHVGGTTFLMPFFTILFLWFLSRSVAADRSGWLISSAVAAGLALQSNPVAGLLVAGGWIWVIFRVRCLPRLGRYWPLWPLVGGLCIALVYSPVILYNITSGLDSVSTAGERSYLWQADPNVFTYLANAWRLALQLVRQVSGVLMGDETFQTIIGLPLLYLACMLAGLAYTTCRVSALPVLVVLPFLIMFPCFSSHYGLIAPIRFTSPLTPVLAACMGLLLAAVGGRIGMLSQPARCWAAVAALALAAMLVVYSLVSLPRYYGSVEENHRSGHTLLALSRQMVEENHGEPVYISTSSRMMGVHGIPYVPHAYLLFADLYQEFLPPEQIIGRLFESPGRATMLISDEDAAIIQQVASLTPWRSIANEEALALGYGVYALDVETPLVKPDFVWAGERALGVAPGVAVGVQVGDMVELMGHDVPTNVAPGATLELTFYWRTVGPVPHETYVGFVHLVDSAMALVAQDDHVLGQERYPLSAWQPDEVVVEHYSLHVPSDALAGRYVLQAGVYTWPDLTRLAVPGHPDDIVALGSVDVMIEP
jgi:hypothetical protein